MKNEILLKRICQLIAQTYCVPLDWIFERAKQIGVDEIVRILENEDENKPKF
jgi:hypothetical protein